MVTLSSYGFTPTTPPTITSSGITLTARYKLRAKFHYGPSNSWHATDYWNNTGFRLDNLPPPGTYVVDLYAVLWNDTTGTFSVTPFNTVSVTISADSITEHCNEFPLSSTTCVCGEFREPDVADEGSCSPPSVKITCEKPIKPQSECGETTFTIEAHPGEIPPFTIVSQLYDENCDAILDEDSEGITTIVA